MRYVGRKLVYGITKIENSPTPLFKARELDLISPVVAEK
jgi:hypothetical protein